MPLKFKITKDEHGALDESKQALYKASGDHFVLDTDDDPRIADLTKKVNEFRDTNKSLAKRLEDAGKIDPKNATLADRLADVEKQLAAEKAEKAKLAQQANAQTLETAIRDHGRKIGLNPDAAPDMLHRATQAGFTIKDGNAVALDSDGNVIASKKVSGAPLTISEWMQDQRQNGAGYMFQKSQGPSSQQPGRRTNGIDVSDDAKVLQDPSAEQIQANLKDIFAGKVVTQFSDAA